MSTPLTSYLQRRWFRGVLYFWFWTLLGVFNAAQSYFIRQTFDLPIVMWKLIVIGLSDWYVWAAIAPFVVKLGQRFPLDQSVWKRHIAAHAAFATLAALLVAAVMLPIVE